MNLEQYIGCLIRYGGRLAAVTSARSNYDGDWLRLHIPDEGRTFEVNAFEAELLRALPDPSFGLLKRRGSAVLFVYRDAEYELSDQPYEPCLYIRKDGAIFRTLHNAFTADELPERLASGEELTGIDGRQYDLAKFCRVLAAAIDGSRSEMDFPFAARQAREG